MTVNCYQQLADALEQGAAVLATVIHTKGSTPREVGAKMVIGANGQTYNTIGGGAGEAKVIQQALQVLQTGQKQQIEIDLSGGVTQTASHSSPKQGICGGIMQVWLERWSGEIAIALVHRILYCLQSGNPATLVIPCTADKLPYLVESSQPLLIHDAYMEPLQASPTLLIVGAGHVGEQLAKVATLAGFQVLVQDDRPEWANPQRYPQADRITHEPVEQLLRSLIEDFNGLTANLYVAIVTRGYQYDVVALQALLSYPLPYRYIGMIGSEKRIRAVYGQLQQQGISPQALQQIHAPIGLEIGALTPEEIAISIVAELIQVRRGGTEKSMSERLRRSPLIT